MTDQMALRESWEVTLTVSVLCIFLLMLSLFLVGYSLYLSVLVGTTKVKQWCIGGDNE